SSGWVYRIAGTPFGRVSSVSGSTSDIGLFQQSPNQKGSPRASSSSSCRFAVFWSLRNKSKIANDCRLVPRRRPLEAPEIDAHWGGRLRNVDRVRRIGFGLDDIGNRSDWVNTIH